MKWLLAPLSLALTLTLALTAGPAQAGNVHTTGQKPVGPFYDPVKIEAFDVGGIRLGLMESEAAAKLSAGNWKGKFPALHDDVEGSVPGFTQPGKELYVFRHRTLGANKVHAVKMIQTFDLAHDTNEVKAALEKKYGKATFADGNAHSMRLVWDAPRLLPDDVYNKCGFGTDTCPALAGKQDMLPQLSADISSKKVELTLGSGRQAQWDIDALKKKRAAQDNAQKQQNAKREKINF